jgi:hypothetical protein
MKNYDTSSARSFSVLRTLVTEIQKINVGFHGDTTATLSLPLLKRQQLEVHVVVVAVVPVDGVRQCHDAYPQTGILFIPRQYMRYGVPEE